MGDTTLYDGPKYRIERATEKDESYELDYVNIHINGDLEHALCLLSDFEDTELYDVRFVTALEESKQALKDPSPQIEFIDNDDNREVLDVSESFETIEDSGDFGDATVFYDKDDHSDATESCVRHERITERDMSEWTNHWQFCEMNLLTE